MFNNIVLSSGHMGCNLCRGIYQMVRDQQTAGTGMASAYTSA